MNSSARTPKEYLASLPPERSLAIREVREEILKNLPPGYEEVVNWGMITYQVPLAVYPDIYNKQPLMYAALANQKSHMGLYLMGPYGSAELLKQLQGGFAAAGKKLDMGKSCIRFKKLDDLPLDVIGKVIAAVPMGKFISSAQAIKRK